MNGSGHLDPAVYSRACKHTRAAGVCREIAPSRADIPLAQSVEGGSGTSSGNINTSWWSDTSWIASQGQYCSEQVWWQSIDKVF